MISEQMVETYLISLHGKVLGAASFSNVPFASSGAQACSNSSDGSVHPNGSVLLLECGGTCCIGSTRMQVGAVVCQYMLVLEPMICIVAIWRPNLAANH